MKPRPPIKAAVRMALLSLVALSTAPGIARASDLAITLPGAPPPEDAPFQIGVTGTNTDGSSVSLTVSIRPADGTPCAPASEDDVGELVIEEFPAAGSFAFAGEYEPLAAGDHLVCAWLDDEGSAPVHAGPVSATVAVRAPRLSVAAGAPARVRPKSAFTVTVDYSAEVPRYLSVVLTRVTDCGAGPGALREVTTSARDVIDGLPVSGAGTATQVVTAPEARGTYVLCSYLEDEPDGSDAAFVGQGRTVQVGAGTARTRKCGDPGGARHITRVRARRVPCRGARRIARAWARGRPAPSAVAGLRCRARRDRVTCAGGGKRVSFRYRPRAG